MAAGILKLCNRRAVPRPGAKMIMGLWDYFIHPKLKKKYLLCVPGMWLSVICR